MWIRKGLFDGLTIMGAIILAGFGLALPGQAWAQSFINTTPAAIGDGTACPGAVNLGGNPSNILNRPITTSGLPAAGSISGIELGFIASHTWRGDIRLQLTNPAGTTRTLIIADTATSGNVDDYNIRLRDGSTTVNEGPATGQGGPHNTDAAPYQFPAGPDNSLAALLSGPMNGTWTVRICDNYFGSDSGNFIQTELFFLTPNTGDLSLTADASNNFPNAGTPVDITYTVFNAGPETQTGVSVDLDFGGETPTATSGDGSVSGLTWTVPNLAAGSSATQTFTFNTGSSFLTFAGEIATANVADPNSTPGNGSTTEDDDASVNVTPQITTPPALACPIAEQVTLDWSTTGTYSWPSGSLSNAYSVGAGTDTTDFALTLSGSTNRLTVVDGVTAPVTQTNYNGGAVGETGVGIGLDFAAQTENVIMTMDLNTANRGVDGVQFTIVDADLGGWIDRLTITGSLDGNAVGFPSLTSSANNYVSGNQVIGRIGNAVADSPDGNVVITFNEPIDQITFIYDNHPDVGPDPAYQLIAIMDLDICPRRFADLTAEKTVEVYDPASEGLYMTPGNEVLYTISVSNSAIATADAEGVDITDVLPDSLRFVSASVTGGLTSGAFSGLPAANTDCAGGACVITYENATLPIDSAGAVVVRALIK